MTSQISNEYDPSAYDPCSPDAKPAVEEHFAELRQKCPVHHHRFSEDQLKQLNDNPFVSGQVDEMYSLTRYTDIEKCLMNPDLFLSAEGSGPERIRPPEGGGTLAWSDGDAHKRSRRIAQPSVSPKVIAPLVPMLQDRIDDLIDGLAAAGRADIMKDFALPLTSGMLTYLLGMPLEKAEDVQEWAMAILSIWGGDDEAAKRGGNAMEAISECVATWGQEQVAAVERGETEPNALTMLITTPDDKGAHFSHGEVVQAFAQMIAGGFESSATAIANGVYLFCTNPDERGKLQERPELINTAVEEVLRYMAPIEGLVRTTSSEVSVGGVTMEEGTKVRAVFASANMDEDVFTEPRRFKIDRDRSELQKHMSFGKGVHTCIGNTLARQEMKLAFTALFNRIPTLDLDPDHQPTRNKVMVIHGFDYLPVKWDPATVLPRESASAPAGAERG
ncbi:cytochrome P450 [Rhodococcus sp. NPDC127530]|uniref:cytochrome P450 n=1 Tax=unclassified Rhodococcus (in: high G+C Gram-positive bacteria) TaxID=192944 RepID=UPI00362A33BE